MGKCKLLAVCVPLWVTVAGVVMPVALAQSDLSQQNAVKPTVGATQNPASSNSQNKAPVDVNVLFGTTCGWCHSDGGRSAGKGPQLMGTSRSDDFIRNRIKHGKEGAMPAFGSSLSDADITAVIHYIRALKPQPS